MPDAQILLKDEFTAEGSLAAIPFKKCLSAPVVTNAGAEAIGALEDFFEDPNIHIEKKKNLYWALGRLGKWSSQQETQTNLVNLSTETIDAFLQAATSKRSRKRFRSGLYHAYGKLVEAKIIERSPMSKVPNRRVPDRNLPAVITRLGEDAVALMNGFMNGDQPLRNKNRWHTLRRFARWVEAKHIYDLRDFSVGDGHLYIQSVLPLKMRWNDTLYLRDIFNALVEGKIFQASPFPYFSEARRDKYISSILSLARNTGTDFEPALKEFLYRGQDISSTHEDVALNHFAVWLASEKVNRLTEVTKEHLIRFREKGFSGLQPTSREKYFSFIRRFFKFLHAQKLLKINPGDWGRGKYWGHGKIDKYIPHSHEKDLEIAETTRLIQQTKMKLTAKMPPKDFAQLDINALPFGDRLILARFIRYVAKYQKAGRALNDTRRYADFLRPIGKRNSPGESVWSFTAKWGVTSINDGNRRFAPGFAERYNTGELIAWADDFVGRYENNMRLYALDPTKESKPAAPAKARSHPARPPAPVSGWQGQFARAAATA